MSQKSITTTTSFIISSDESLNKPPLSSSQSTDSNDNMTASDSVQNNQYFVSLNPVNNPNNMVLNQQNRLHSSTLPPQPPPYSIQEPLYGPPPNFSMDSVPTNNQNSQFIQSNGNQCNGNSVTTSMIYAIYNENNLQSSKLCTDIKSKISSDDNVQDHQQFHQQPQPYTSENDLRSTTTILSSDRTRAHLIYDRNINGNKQQSKKSLYHHTKNVTYSSKLNPSVQSFHQNKQSTNGQRSSISSLESSASSSLMPINVKGMLLHGISNDEVLRNWLTSINCEEYLKNFIENGYDMLLLTRMTPQDLTAIGCKSPELRKKLLLAIKKLNLGDDIPECRPHSLEQWLELLKLSEYYDRLCDEGYDTIDKVCGLTWEDLEEIGINKLGHQKRLILGIERVQKFDKQEEERQNDHAIYDVHPNHRICLNQNSLDNRLSTLGRSTVRSGFFQTRSGANLDHRGLPVATVMPALKHVTNSIANLDISHQVVTTIDCAKSIIQNTNGHGNNRFSINDQSNQNEPVYQAGKSENTLKMSDISVTMKRNPPPLPPVRTNSLKLPQDSVGQLNNNSIYGNSYGILQNHGANCVAPSTGSTSFLRTPKLGTLTATTNKMLTLGGHIQSMNGQSITTIRSILPIREAPLPPLPTQPPPTIPEKIEEEDGSVNNFRDSLNRVESSSLISQSLIGHQLASADEFPPPPPSQ